MENEDGHTIARQLIELEQTNRTGFLDLSGLGLTQIPEEIGSVPHLYALKIGAWHHEFGEIDEFASFRVDSLRSFQAHWWYETYICKNIESEFYKNIFSQRKRYGKNRIIDLSPIKLLKDLKNLDVSDLPVGRLDFALLPAGIESINCSRASTEFPNNIDALQNLSKINLNGIDILDMNKLMFCESISHIVCRNVRSIIVSAQPARDPAL